MFELGYTPQYISLNKLGDEISHLTILGIPCNQFGKQVEIANPHLIQLGCTCSLLFHFDKEPGKNHEEIMNGIRYVRPGNGFQPKFPILEKSDVNGNQQLDIYKVFKVC